MKNKELGYRGYIGSRPYPCGDYPQNVQNLIIRNHCQKHKIGYLLSATEYMMTDCFMMLEQVLSNLSSVDGIILFSIFMLPSSSNKRKKIYEKIINANSQLHAALEDLVISKWDDVQAIEDLLRLHNIAKSESDMKVVEDFISNEFIE